MGTVTINIDDNTEDRFRSYIYKESGKSKGALGKAVTEAIDKWLEERKQTKIAEEALKRMKKGYNMGGFKIKSRDELYGRR